MYDPGYAPTGYQNSSPPRGKSSPVSGTTRVMISHDLPARSNVGGKLDRKVEKGAEKIRSTAPSVVASYVKQYLNDEPVPAAFPSTTLQFNDVEQILRVVAEATDPTADQSIGDRRRILMQGVAQLLNVDIWYWATMQFNPEISGDRKPTHMIDGGGCSDHERVVFHRVLTNPKLKRMTAGSRKLVRNRHATIGREAHTEPQESLLPVDAPEAVGSGQFLWNFYPVGDTIWSCIGLYRRRRKLAFTDRDRTVARVIFHQVDWLHQYATDVYAPDKAPALSRREREVLKCLLSGDSQKEIAQKLALSHHTVGGYVKQIYKQFSVSSRAELMAHFISAVAANSH